MNKRNIYFFEMIFNYQIIGILISIFFETYKIISLNKKIKEIDKDDRIFKIFLNNKYIS